MNHFLDIHTTEPAVLRAMIESAKTVKAARIGKGKAEPDLALPLAGKMVALVFEKPSTRTRTSFDVGVRQLGGQSMILSGGEIHLGSGGESVADTARVLSRFADMIMIRTFEHQTLLEMAEYATVPVINGLTNDTHPCQIMADIMTYEERRGPIKGRKVVWVGDGNNVCTSFLHAAGQFGFNLTFTGPEALDPNAAALEFARSKGVEALIERDPARAVVGADLVVTDTWVSMHDSQATRAHRHTQLQPYQVNADLMSKALDDALLMHCLPAHRGEEATSEVLDSPASVIFDEAENRLHAQKAIMDWCIKNGSLD